MTYEELDLLLDIITLRKNIKKHIKFLESIPNPHHKAHIPESLTNKQKRSQQTAHNVSIFAMQIKAELRAI